MSPHCTQVAGFTKVYWIPRGRGGGREGGWRQAPRCGGSWLGRPGRGRVWAVADGRPVVRGAQPSATRRETVRVEKARPKGKCRPRRRPGGPRGGRRQREQPLQRLRGRTTSGIPPGPQEARGGGWGDWRAGASGHREAGQAHLPLFDKLGQVFRLPLLPPEAPGGPSCRGGLTTPQGVSASISLAAGSCITWRETQAVPVPVPVPWGAGTSSQPCPGGPATCPCPSPHPSCS